MKRVNKIEEIEGQESGEEQGKLRRWVSNLQLESWQLELLITGFSIFLLASSLEQYDDFRLSVEFDKLTPGSNSSNPLFALSGKFLLDTIPWALRFFLINLLVHLLLRGFWIGIVGLSSVSSVIDFESLKLRGKFRKYIPQKVQSLDELIVYLDRVSSVIFAYTYLLVFSILSVVIVFVLIIVLFGMVILLSNVAAGGIMFFVINMIMSFTVILVVIGALLFFIDSTFFSVFKKSRWFSSIYYYIYRFFSFVSLSFIYRSIYYHLITNYKKKQIASVSVVLLLLFLAWNSFTDWNLHKFFPERRGNTEYMVESRFYDDVRGNFYIKSTSIPSKYVKNGFLEIFIHYDPSYNDVMRFKCPEMESLNMDVSFSEGFKAGIEIGADSTKSLSELLPTDLEYGNKVQLAAQCLSQVFQIRVDDQLIENPPFSFYTHPSKGERGFLVILDIEKMARGRHNLEVSYLRFDGISFMQDVSAGKLKFTTLSRLPFWKL